MAAMAAVVSKRFRATSVVFSFMVLGSLLLVASCQPEPVAMGAMRLALP